MNPFQELLHLLSDPNISFILFTIGFYGLLFELQNPNFVTGHPGRARDHPRVHRVWQPAAQRRRPAADPAGGRAVRARAHGHQPRAAGRGRARRASRWVRPPCSRSRATRSSRWPRWRPGVIVTTTVTAGIFLGLIVWAAVRSRGMASPAGRLRHVGGASRRDRRGRPRGDRAARLRVRGRRGVVRAHEPTEPTLERGTPVRVIATEGLDPHRRARPVIIVAVLIERRS